MANPNDTQGTDRSGRIILSIFIVLAVVTIAGTLISTYLGWGLPFLSDEAPRPVVESPDVVPEG